MKGRNNMVATTPQIRYARIPAWLRELQFVTDFSSWLFALCSRLAEPFMLICTLFIVAEAGVPSISLPALHNLAIGIMITAPEIILPGAFVVASQAQEHALLLFAVCWTFVGLTLLTLMSLFVWHFTGASLAWLMCARCATAVGYSILMRVMHQGEQSVIADRTANDLSNTEAFNQVIEQVRTLATSVSTITVSVTELRTSVTKMSTTSASVALPMPVSGSEYVPIVASEQVLARVGNHSDFCLVEHGNMPDESTETFTDEQERTSTAEPRLLAPVQSVHPEQNANTGDRIRTALADNPDLSDRELAALVGCSASTANKWRRRIEQVA
jgi:hypothetical protein